MGTKCVFAGHADRWGVHGWGVPCGGVLGGWWTTSTSPTAVHSHPQLSTFPSPVGRPVVPKRCWWKPVRHISTDRGVGGCVGCLWSSSRCLWVRGGQLCTACGQKWDNSRSCLWKVELWTDWTRMRFSAGAMRRRTRLAQKGRVRRRRDPHSVRDWSPALCGGMGRALVPIDRRKHQRRRELSAGPARTSGEVDGKGGGLEALESPPRRRRAEGFWLEGVLRSEGVSRKLRRDVLGSLVRRGACAPQASDQKKRLAGKASRAGMRAVVRRTAA